MARLVRSARSRYCDVDETMGAKWASPITRSKPIEGGGVSLKIRCRGHIHTVEIMFSGQIRLLNHRDSPIQEQYNGHLAGLIMGGRGDSCLEILRSAKLVAFCLKAALLETKKSRDLYSESYRRMNSSSILAQARWKDPKTYNKATLADVRINKSIWTRVGSLLAHIAAYRYNSRCGESKKSDDSQIIRAMSYVEQTLEVGKVEEGPVFFDWRTMATVFMLSRYDRPDEKEPFALHVRKRIAAFTSIRSKLQYLGGSRGRVAITLHPTSQTIQVSTTVSRGAVRTNLILPLDLVAFGRIKILPSPGDKDRCLIISSKIPFRAEIVDGAPITMHLQKEGVLQWQASQVRL